MWLKSIVIFPSKHLSGSKSSKLKDHQIDFKNNNFRILTIFSAILDSS